MFIFASTFMPENNLPELNVPQWFRIKTYISFKCKMHPTQCIHSICTIPFFMVCKTQKKYETIITFEMSWYVEEF